MIIRLVMSFPKTILNVGLAAPNALLAVVIIWN
jgi:hypothetical protein